MATLIRTPASPSVDSQQLLKGVHFALERFAKELSAQLASLVEAQFAAGKASRKAVEKAVAAQVPALLEQAFIANFLAGETSVRERRAVLAHLLSAAELQASVGAGLAAFPGKTTASAEEDDELTSEAAAKLLHVSRTHLNTLADSGAFGPVRRTDGGHRRISKAALLKYKAQSQERQAKGLDAMMAASQKLGLYDAELAGLPVRGGR